MNHPDDLPMWNSPFYHQSSHSCGSYHRNGICDCDIPMFQMQSSSLMNQGWNEYQEVETVVNTKVAPRDVGGGYRLVKDIDDIPIYLMERYELTGDYNDIPSFLLESCNPVEPPRIDYEPANIPPPTTSVTSTNDFIPEVEVVEPFEIVKEEEPATVPEPPTPVVSIVELSIEDELQALLEVDTSGFTQLGESDEDFDLEAELQELLGIVTTDDLKGDELDVEESLDTSHSTLAFVDLAEISSRKKAVDDDPYEDPFWDEPIKSNNLLLQAAFGGESFVDSRVGSIFFMIMRKILVDTYYTTRGVNDWLTLLIRGTFSTDFTCRPISVGKDDLH